MYVFVKDNVEQESYTFNSRNIPVNCRTDITGKK